MGKLLKPGRVVVVTNGRHAGMKGVVVSLNENGTNDRPFGHALVAGVSRPPRKVHKRMSKEKIEKRVEVHSFLKTINFNHLIPTRYVVSQDVDLKAVVGDIQLNDRQARRGAKENLSKIFQEKFLDPVNSKTNRASKDILFLRTKLRF